MNWGSVQRDFQIENLIPQGIRPGGFKQVCQKITHPGLIPMRGNLPWGLITRWVNPLPPPPRPPRVWQSDTPGSQFFLTYNYSKTPKYFNLLARGLNDAKNWTKFNWPTKCVIVYIRGVFYSCLNWKVAKTPCIIKNLRRILLSLVILSLLYSFFFPRSV